MIVANCISYNFFRIEYLQTNGGWASNIFNLKPELLNPVDGILNQ